MNKLLVILGSTATGKTDLALVLAKKFNGEIIACDSRQVYTGLDIGTGKLPGGDFRFKNYDLRIIKGKGWWEIDGVKVWMYDVADPKKQYNVARFVKQANKVIKNVNKRGKLPILVCGTGLYLKALLEGLANLTIPVDNILRKKLQKLSKENLQERLKNISHQKWDSLNESDRENPRRLVRAIELALVPAQKRFKIYDLGFKNLDILRIGLTAPRAILYERVDERVIDRINQGMIEEAKKLHNNGLTLERMRQLGLEYRCLADYLDGNINDRKELIRMLQIKIHGFVRRQVTWFKREKDVYWFNISQENFAGKVEKLVKRWYH